MHHTCPRKRTIQHWNLNWRPAPDAAGISVASHNAWCSGDTASQDPDYLNVYIDIWLHLLNKNGHTHIIKKKYICTTIYINTYHVDYWSDWNYQQLEAWLGLYDALMGLQHVRTAFWVAPPRPTCQQIVKAIFWKANTKPVTISKYSNLFHPWMPT